MTVLVDSDILIEVSRGRDAAVVSRWIGLSQSDAVILYSAVTAAELWACARPSEHAPLETLLAALVCVPTDAAGPVSIYGATESATASNLEMP